MISSHRIAVSSVVDEAIRRHGEETYPHECCGALVGNIGGVGPIEQSGRVTATVPLPNTTEEGPRRRFLVRPSDYRAAEARATAGGHELLGFYHSHPDHPARPSQYDLDHAWPSFSYIIISVGDGEPGALTSWRLREDRSQFDPEDVVAPA